MLAFQARSFANMFSKIGIELILLIIKRSHPKLY